MEKYWVVKITTATVAKAALYNLRFIDWCG